jgi:hypothetical protein
MWATPFDKMYDISQAIIQARFGFSEMANVLLGMPGRNLHMNHQIFPLENGTKLPFSDVP